MKDVFVAAGPGAPHGIVIPASEILERFSHASGPGGQGVNTTDSRVQLSFDIAHSQAFDEAQRARILRALASRVSDGVLTITAADTRSQFRNRKAAREKLALIIREAVMPPAVRRATRPTRASLRRRREAKIHKSTVKALRHRPPTD
ncbi:MAG: aminoacyl-tRNA hydrolase [Ancrocorticia sp.]|jgi:ribosome-associated protein|nr:aminoacyl-tRNA hydrolase [Ancrocorticia sp.]MCI1964449.1 aminoacyl-tRNA hydrolase [Ancrocorticia sp.]MCI2002260.1 aminoacyl-tRNA hydrolase [Ancrocorticia sp.]MCI2179222.1 aminoacyl-tRNA hydrolase [Ancrocorticia sp.]MCI2194401.1 aminoacyl-tRNA hydrolase [Ancrocorticia sp.]